MNVEALVTLMTACATAIGAIYAYMAKTHAKEAREKAVIVEDAVNHRHSHEGEPRLYDMVLGNTRMLKDNEFAHAALFEGLERLEAIVERHITWEETVKYPSTMGDSDDG